MGGFVVGESPDEFVSGDDTRFAFGAGGNSGDDVSKISRGV